MTKVREPLSMENALYLVLGELTIERAAAATGRAESYLRSLSDPEKREQLSVRDLELLDRAHDTRFGTGFPLYEALGLRLETERGARFADVSAIGHHAVELAREHGEACAALFDVTLSPDSDAKLEHALRQVEDVVREGSEAIATMRSAMAHRGASRAPP